MFNPILGILASSGAVAGGSYESIATVSLSSAQANIEFTSIPSTYKHLQIRAIARTNYTSGDFDAFKINFNSDTGNNYAWHQLGGNGTVAFAQASSSTNTIYAAYCTSNNAGSNVFGVSIIDILDYGSTSKYKTLRNLTGADNNGNGNLTLGSGLWQSTSAITSITIDQWDGTNFNQYSHFALYGVKD